MFGPPPLTCAPYMRTTVSFFRRSAFSRPPRTLEFLLLGLISLLSGVKSGDAQTALPTATEAPAISPIPAASPAPTASLAPNVSPGTIVTPGAIDLTAYNQARQPSAKIAVIFPVSTISALPQQGFATHVDAKAAATSAAATGIATALQPTLLGGVFSEVNLGYLNGAKLPPSARLTLQFDASRAGAAVWVQALDGGTLQTQDATGNSVDIAGGGWIELDSAGQISFTFQAPALSARYQVMVRLDNVSTVLPFIVPDPTQG